MTSLMTSVMTSQLRRSLDGGESTMSIRPWNLDYDSRMGSISNPPLQRAMSTEVVTLKNCRTGHYRMTSLMTSLYEATSAPVTRRRPVDDRYSNVQCRLRFSNGENIEPAARPCNVVQDGQLRRLYNRKQKDNGIDDIIDDVTSNPGRAGRRPPTDRRIRRLAPSNGSPPESARSLESLASLQ